MTWRRPAAVVLAVLALGGCVTAGRPPVMAVDPPPTAEPAPDDRVAQVRQDCHQSAAGAVGSTVLAAAFNSAGLASVYLVLRGAADGAWWGFIAGGGSGARDGAWIGAAAGAGLGVIIGVGAGIKEGVDAYGRYRAAFDMCVATPAGVYNSTH